MGMAMGLCMHASMAFCTCCMVTNGSLQYGTMVAWLCRKPSATRLLSVRAQPLAGYPAVPSCPKSEARMLGHACFCSDRSRGCPHHLLCGVHLHAGCHKGFVQEGHAGLQAKGKGGLVGPQHVPLVQARGLAHGLPAWHNSVGCSSNLSCLKSDKFLRHSRAAVRSQAHRQQIMYSCVSVIVQAAARQHLCNGCRPAPWDHTASVHGPLEGLCSGL